MIEAQFEYKCRRCGGIYRNPCLSPDMARQLLTELTRAGAGIRAPRGIGLYLHDVHRCDDDGEGLTDLQGYRVVDTEVAHGECAKRELRAHDAVAPCA